MKRLAAWVLVLAMLWAGNMAALADDQCCCCDQGVQENYNIEDIDPVELDPLWRGTNVDDFFRRWGWLCVELDREIEHVEKVEAIAENAMWSCTRNADLFDIDSYLISLTFSYENSTLEEKKLDIYAFIYAARDDLWGNGKDYVLQWILTNGDLELEYILEKSDLTYSNRFKWGGYFIRVSDELGEVELK